MTMLGAAWVTRAELTDAPGDVLGRASYFHAARAELVVRLEKTICTCSSPHGRRARSH